MILKKIIFFSHNKNKIKEITKLFQSSKINVMNLDDLSNIKIPKESGSTFEENANIKSSYGFKKFKLPCFADDSGICINALNGRPGINSKNFLNQNKNIDKILSFIIDKTKKISDDKAYFQTTISLTLNQSNTIFFTGIIKGKISQRPKGSFGFGYDPIFIPKGYSKTFGEMHIKEKNSISHRAIAINKLKKYLLNSLN